MGCDVTFGDKWRKGLLNSWIVSEANGWLEYYFLVSFNIFHFKGYTVGVSKGAKMKYSHLKFSREIPANLDFWGNSKRVTNRQTLKKLRKFMTKATIRNERREE